jgi:UV excision repair protein RAD23
MAVFPLLISPSVHPKGIPSHLEAEASGTASAQGPPAGGAAPAAPQQQSAPAAAAATPAQGAQPQNLFQVSALY